jgi:DNA/RNA endonuclease G (NUC1)
MSRDQGLEHIDETSDIEVIAVMAPNDAGVRNADWTTWKTTVDAIEASTGYDLLALLNDRIEGEAESNSKAPVAVVNGPYMGNEGSPSQ